MRKTDLWFDEDLPQFENIVEKANTILHTTTTNNNNNNDNNNNNNNCSSATFITCEL